MTQNQLTSQYAPCPNCGSTDAKKVTYTWWGGLLGPNMLTHVRCNKCNTEYNGKTGQSNTNNIIIYTIVSLVLAFCVCGGMMALVFAMNN